MIELVLLMHPHYLPDIPYQHANSAKNPPLK